MARLVYEITGDISGLQSAINTGINLIQKLSDTPNQVKINVPDISAQIVKGVAALDQLDSKLAVIRGNAVLFGDSLKGQTQELNAYQSAINTLLANGFDPLDGDVQRLKIHIDELTNSFHNVQSAQASVGNNAKESFAEVQAFLNANRNAQAPAQNVAVNAPFGGSDPSRGVLTGLNQQLLAGTISVQEYNAALAEANLSIHAISESAAGSTSAFEAQIGVIQGLKEQLASLNAQRIVAPQEDLARINAEIQQTEVSLQQATNIGKVGFDQMGNSIRGVSVQNINGQLFALSNNLFGARQISKDLVRTFDSTSVGTFARSIGLLGVDFLFFAQNAQFAKVSTVGATAAMAVEGEVAATSALSTGALGAAFTSLLTPTSLIVLGIAVAGAAFIAYENAQKNATKSATEHLKAIREQKQALEDLVSIQSAEAQVQAGAVDKTGDQVIKLKELYFAVKNNTGALFDGKTALQDLQETYPAFFKDLDEAASKTDALTDAYGKAKNALEALGRFQAANQLALESTKIAEKNQVLADALIKPLTEAKNALDKAAEVFKKENQSLTQTFSGPGQGGASAPAQNLNVLQKAYRDIFDQIKGYNTQIAEANAQTNAFFDIANKNAPTAGLIFKAKDFSGPKEIENQFASLDERLNELIQKSSSLAGNSGIQGYASEIESIVKRFTDLNNLINKFQIAVNKAFDRGALTDNQRNTLLSPLTNLRTALPQNEDSALNQAKIKDAQATADAIQKINDQFGVKQQTGYDQELLRIKKLYDSLTEEAEKNVLTREQIEQNYQNAVKAALGNSALIANAKTIRDAEVQQAEDADAKIVAARAALLPAISAIDDKYIQQEQQVYSRITDIADAAMANLVTGEEARTDKIILEGQKRVTAANAEFNKLRDLAKGLPQASTDKINNIQAQVNLLINQSTFEKVSEEISKNFASAMQTAVNGFVSNFYTAITSLGQQRQDIDNKYASQLSKASNQATINQINNLKRLEKQSTLSFGSIFSSLVSKFQSAFNESILSSFTKQFTENLGKTLLTPTAKQLTISPEEQSAQNVAVLLKTAGSDLASQITQAGNAFAAKISTISIDKGLLNGASGGSLLQASGLSAKDSIITPALTNQLAVSGEQAGKAIETGGAVAAAAAVGAATAAATTTTTAASTAAGKISSAAAGIAAAASLAGGLISGATSPTSSAGQGIGGALSGAGEGALLGTAIAPGVGTIVGAAAGFLIGGISGIFSASKARKQEELQKKQLEQQQETNALLARANALAYTASIVGRMTTQGIVTGADVNAFGQLTATVNGKTLQFVLDRSSNGR